MVITGVTAGLLFFTLWWMLHSSGDEAPWIPAGLAASVVMLVAVAAREVIMRRAWTRYILEQEGYDQIDSSGARQRHESGMSSSSVNRGRRSSFDKHTAALRAVQKRSAEADAPGSLPETHLDVYQLCKEYLAGTEESLRSSSLTIEKNVALRAGQDRVRALQKHHLLAWASGASRSLTHEAQRRARLSDKLETALRALDVIESALRFYPDEAELHESSAAIREFMTSAKVAHWVELAERAAFKGHYRRAIDRYRDALFYLSREQMKEGVRAEMAGKIGREIEILRARLKVNKMSAQERARPSQEGQVTEQK